MEFRSLFLVISLEVALIYLLALKKEALALNWTRDPFDRLIVAHANVIKCHLITKDSFIKSHFSKVIW